jgi:hypothetical protein
MLGIRSINFGPVDFGAVWCGHVFPFRLGITDGELGAVGWEWEVVERRGVEECGFMGLAGRGTELRRVSWALLSMGP